MVCASKEVFIGRRLAVLHQRIRLIGACCVPGHHISTPEDGHPVIYEVAFNISERNSELAAGRPGLSSPH
jgi:hypothetical protein